MPDRFKDFLRKNSIVASAPLPLVHTTDSYNLDRLSVEGLISPRTCDVFRTPLSYFFLGRPAYKLKSSGGQAFHWQLPTCFIFQFDAVSTPEKIFPFDSGAHFHGKLPPFIQRMPLDEFEAHSVTDASTKIVGAYFPDLTAYMEGTGKTTTEFQREFTLGVFDAEVQAVHHLSINRYDNALDDRRFTVEVATAETVDLKVNKPLAVVAPAPYFADAGFTKTVVEDWGAQAIGYPMSTLNTESYYGQIYERINTFYKTELRIL